MWVQQRREQRRQVETSRRIHAYTCVRASSMGKTTPSLPRFPTQTSVFLIGLPTFPSKAKKNKDRQKTRKSESLQSIHLTRPTHSTAHISNTTTHSNFPPKRLPLHRNYLSHQSSSIPSKQFPQNNSLKESPRPLGFYLPPFSNPYLIPSFPIPGRQHHLPEPIAKKGTAMSVCAPRVCVCCMRV